MSAFHIIGDAGYKKYGTFHTKTSFGMGTMQFNNIFNEYVELDEWNEVFELQPPGLSFHNLIMGQPYIDIENTAHMIDIKKPEKRAVI